MEQQEITQEGQKEVDTVDTKQQEQKTFTNADVERIVKSRLAGYRKSAAKEIEAEYQEKFSALEKREKDFILQSALSKRGLAEELASIVSFTDEDDLNSKLDQLEAIYGKQETKEEPTQNSGFRQIGGSMESDSKSGVVDPIREAMNLK